MDSQDHRRFQLVLVHGITDSPSSRSEADKFWSARYPQAAVTSVSFLVEDVVWGTTGLVETALRLLEAVECDRLSASEESKESDQVIPCVFLGHELGGSLVKQALILASKNKKYYELTRRIALLVFYGTPDFKEDTLSWEHDVIRLLSASDLDSHSPAPLLRELPVALDHLTWEYCGISEHYNADIRNNSEAFSWNFTPGNPATEPISDTINRAVDRKLRTISKELHQFMRTLSNIDSNDYQLQLQRPFSSSLGWITQHPSYDSWETLDSKTPNILYIHDAPGSSSAIIASQLFFELQKVAAEATIITFSFSKQDLRTQPIATFFTSLIRQMFLSRPWLLRRVSSITESIQGEKVFSYEILRSLLLSLLRASLSKPVVLILHGAQDCGALTVDHLVALVKEYRRIATGVFKVIILDEGHSNQALNVDTEISRGIDLSENERSSSFLEAYIRAKMDAIVKVNHHWQHCTEDAVQKLNTQPLSFVRTALAARLLETARLPSTQSAAMKALKELPETVDDTFNMALERCQSECGLVMSSLLRWILHAVRPLTLRELSVVAALSSAQKLAIDTVKLNLPTRLAHDLQGYNETLIRILGIHIQPIYGTVGSALVRNATDNPDSIILSNCLDYLEMAFESLDTDSQGLDIAITSDLITGPEGELLEYAVAEWPQHYSRAPASSTMRDRVLEFFGKQKSIEAWFKLYQTHTGFSSERYSDLDNGLKIACWFGLLDLAKETIQQAKAMEDHETALTQALDLAAGNGQEGAVSLLLEAGAVCGDAMCWAADGGFLNIIETLYEANQDMINKNDRFGRPPFVLAALSGNEEIAAYLLDKGADSEVAVGYNLTALHVAATTGQMAIVRPLIDAGVDVKAVSDGGDDALRMAAAGGFDDIVTLLLKLDVEKDGQNNNGKTALHLAVEHGHASTCEVLFEAGASIQIKTNDGFSPVHLAAKEGFLDILQWLISNPESFEVAESGAAEAEVARDQKEEKEEASQDEDESRDGEESKGGDKRELDPNCFDEEAGVLSPLQLAARNGNLEVIRELLKHTHYNTERSRATSLLLAAKEGFVELVEELLKSEITTAIRNPKGDTALHLAAAQQHSDIVARLVDPSSGSPGVFDVNAKNESGWTPLHFAAMSGRLLTILTLLEHGAKMSDETNVGQTVLHIAASYGHSFVFKELLRHLSDGHAKEQDIIFVQDEGGHTAFTLAVGRNNLSVVTALLQTVSSSTRKVTDLQGKKKNALKVAAQGNQIEAARLLLDSGWDVNDGGEDGVTALHHAAEAGGVPLIQLLLERGADPNASGFNGERPLHKAVRVNPGAVKALLQNNATNINLKNDDDETPLWRAAWAGQLGCVEELLKWSPDLDAEEKLREFTALHAAYDSPDITQRLLSAGANPTKFNEGGEPPFLYVADQTNGLETIQHYLDVKVDPNTRNSRGYTAIHIAAESGKLDNVKLLEANGTDIHATGVEGESALHLAAFEGHLHVVEYLLERGVDANKHSKARGTPLMAAADGVEAPVIEKLLEKRADANATSEDFEYHTALQAAVWRNSEPTVQALLDGHADVNLVGGTYGSPLCAAVAAESQDIALLLLKAGAHIDYAAGPKGTVLEYALSRGASEIVDLCLEWNAKVDVLSKGKHGTALLAAIHSENLDKVKTLLERGAPPNLCPDNGETPTQAAIRKGRGEILEAILNQGGQLSFRDKYGRGPLSNTITNKSLGVLSYLWGREGVNIDEKDAVGRTPLMLAVLQGVDIVRDLHSKGANLDLQDQWGKTALMYAIIRDYPTLVSELIGCGADLFTTDVRGHDAMYWACSKSSPDTFSQVLKEMKKLRATPSRFQRAINAAVASSRPELIKRLLADTKYSQKQSDDDGWTASHTALRYGNPNVGQIIKDAIIEAGQQVVEPLPPVKLPTEWHEFDLSAGLVRGTDTKTITISETYQPIKVDDPKGVVRADYPMWPQENGVYYFEVTIANEGNGEKRRFAVGFCDENASLGIQLGWMEGSWGYHGDDGKAFGAGEHDNGIPYGPTYGEGDVIGCGVNFDQGTAFYTKNGEIIGQAFTDVRGKLYPAISVDVRMVGCAFSARFWESKDIGNKDFKFKGPFNDQKTFEKSQRAATVANTASSLGSDDESTMSSDTWYSDDESRG